MSTNQSNKSELRQIYIKKRKSISQDQVELKSRSICHLLYSFIANLRCEGHFGSQNIGVGLFSAIQNEPKLEELFCSMVAGAGFFTSYPRIIDEKAAQMEFRFLNSLEQLVPGPLGIKEPDILFCPITIPQIVLVPGICFDRFGHRIGFGRGYYDRFFHSNKIYLKVGVCFQDLILNESICGELVPGPYDVPMDYIATEEGVLSCEQRKN